MIDTSCFDEKVNRILVEEQNFYSMWFRGTKAREYL